VIARSDEGDTLGGMSDPGKFLSIECVDGDLVREGSDGDLQLNSQLKVHEITLRS